MQISLFLLLYPSCNLHFSKFFFIFVNDIIDCSNDICCSLNIHYIMKTKSLDEKENPAYEKPEVQVFELPRQPVSLQGTRSEPTPISGEVD